MNDFLLPLLITATLAAVVLFVVWLLHSYNLSAGRKELESYKEQVVALSDKIDALKERHKLLPHMNQNFGGPMSGETLAAYNQIAERLEHHRSAWLKLMDAWEAAQSLLESESFLGNRRARSARKNLRAAEAPAALAAVIADCETPLDRIEHAHAQAAADLQSFQQEEQQLSSQFDAIKAAALAIAPYLPDRSAAVSLVDRSHELLPADPLGALHGLNDARAKVADIRRRVSKILEHAAALNGLAKQFAELQHITTQRRAQGFLLQEEGANPDPLLADLQRQQAAVRTALDQGDDNAAGTLLSQAAAIAQQTRQGLERHVAAKARCEAEIPAQHAEAKRLADGHALARGQLAELTRDFAADTWLGVAENVPRAQASLAAAEKYIAEATRLAAASVQHFSHATKLLDQATENHKHAQAELTALGKRLKELVELRASFQAQLNQIRGRAERVNQLLQSSNADRLLANERFRAARLALDRLFDDSRLPRPDWTRLTMRAKEIDADLERVEQLAKEDLRLEQQAAAEIAETDKVIREARTFHQHGISADVSAAESELAQARGCLTSQGYEEAIRLANAAEQLARTAYQDAMGRAQRRQQELESQHRAEQAAAIPSPLLQAEEEPTLPNSNQGRIII